MHVEFSILKVTSEPATPSTLQDLQLDLWISYTQCIVKCQVILVY